jgi:hypothetical protein
MLQKRIEGDGRISVSIIQWNESRETPRVYRRAAGS